MVGADNRASAPPAAAAPENGSDAVGEATRGFVHLRKRADFLRVAKGQRFHTSAFSLQAALGGDPSAAAAPRFGLTVTKKIGGAVQRNRIRRRLREAVRAAALAARPGHDYVLVAREAALVAPFMQITGDLVRALGRVHAQRGGRRPGKPETGTQALSVRPADLDHVSRRSRGGTAACAPTQSGETQ